MAKVGGAILGLLLAFIAQYLAFGMAGAGHGWGAPFVASLTLWPLLPLTFATASPFRPYKSGKRGYLLTLSIVGLALDVALIVLTNLEGVEYFWKVTDLAGPIALIWLSIWLSWQVWAALALSQGEELSEDVI